MIKVIKARIQQKYRTIPYPKSSPVLPDRFRGRPVINQAKCGNFGEKASCEACIKACPTGAISRDTSVKIDMGKCLFCTACSRACEGGSLRFSQDHRISTRSRSDLIVDGSGKKNGVAVSHEIKRLFGRSLALRQVSAGGCNACEADINVLSTVVFDLGRFGVQIVASPRHADGLIVTGPVTENMKIALEKTWAAVPDPKIVIALGACAISGGPFVTCDQHHSGVDKIIPVDLYVPGCPPHPLTILDGLLGILGKL